MFHSNQRLEISGETKDLERILSFILDLHDRKDVFGDDMYTRKDHTVHLAWAILGDNQLFCLSNGTIDGYPSEPDDSKIEWKDFPAPLDINLVVQTIESWLNKQSYPYSCCDGISYRGFLCKACEWGNEDTSKLGIDPEDLFEAIVCIKPYNCEYAK